MAIVFSNKAKIIILSLLIISIALLVNTFYSRSKTLLSGDIAPKLCSNRQPTLVAIAISPDGEKVAAVDLDGQVIIIATKTDSISATIPIPAYRGPAAVAFSPDNSRIFVASRSRISPITIEVIDTNLNKIIKSFSISGDMQDEQEILVSKDGLKLYLAVSMQKVLVINSSTGEIIKSIVVADGFKKHLTMSPDGSNIYVIGLSLSQLNTSMDIVEKTTAIEYELFESSLGIAINPEGSLLAVGTLGFPGPGTVEVINLKNFTSSYKIPLSEERHPRSISFSPNGESIFVSNSDYQTHLTSISIINVEEKAVTSMIKLSGYSAVGVPITPDGKKGYVGIHDRDGAYIVVVDTNNGTTLTKIQTPLSSKVDILSCTFLAQ